MNLRFLLIFILALFGCSTDLLIPCEEEGNQAGEICREYRYFNNVSRGYIEFEHRQDTAIIASFYDQYTELKKTRTHRFLNGRTVAIIDQFPNATSQIETWHYNAADSLETIVYGANDSSVVITYMNGKRDRQTYFTNEELNRYIVYRYFQDDGNLYRKSYYNAEDSLLHYQNYQYFSTGQERISFYTSDNELLGKEVSSFSQMGLIISSEFTDANGIVTNRNNYIYNASGKLTEKNIVNINHTSKSIFLYY